MLDYIFGTYEDYHQRKLQLNRIIYRWFYNFFIYVLFVENIIMLRSVLFQRKVICIVKFCNYLNNLYANESMMFKKKLTLFFKKLTGELQ